MRMSGATSNGKVSFLSDLIDVHSHYSRDTGYIVVRLRQAVLTRTLVENEDPLFPAFNSLKSTLDGDGVLCVLHKKTKDKKFSMANRQLVPDNTTVIYYSVIQDSSCSGNEISQKFAVNVEDLDLNFMFCFPNGDMGRQLAMQCFAEITKQLAQRCVLQSSKRLRDCGTDGAMEPPAQSSPPLEDPFGDLTPPTLMFSRSVSYSGAGSTIEPTHSPELLRPNTVPPDLDVVSSGPQCYF